MKTKILCITPIKHLKGVYEKLLSFGEIVYLPNISKSELIEFLKSNNVSYIFTNPNKQGFILNEEILKYSEIKIINTCSTGLNHIDIDYCNTKGIDVWSLTTDYELINDLPSTSELAFGLMLSLLRNIPKSFDNVKDGNWNYEPFIGHQVKGLTIGIIGYGRLGKIMKRLFSGWDVEVLIDDPYVDCNKVDKDYLIMNSDVIFLHVHVTEETKEMVNKTFLLNCAENVKIINTSRGEIVNEIDLVEFLRRNKKSKYMTDVINNEITDKENSPILKGLKDQDLENQIFITSHIGGMTHDARYLAYHHSANSLIKYHFTNE